MPNKISNLLLALRIHSTLRGFHFLRHGLSLCLKNEDYLLAVYARLYRDIARDLDTTPANVERCIRTAVSNCYYRGGRDLLCEIAGYPILEKPTNGEFLDILYHYLKNQEKGPA